MNEIWFSSIKNYKDGSRKIMHQIIIDRKNMKKILESEGTWRVITEETELEMR